MNKFIGLLAFVALAWWWTSAEALTPTSRFGIRYKAGDDVIIEGTAQVDSLDSLLVGGRAVGTMVWQDTTLLRLDSLRVSGGTVVGGIVTANKAEVAAGTAAALSIRGSADTNTGLAWLGNDTLAVSTGGTERWRVSAAGVRTPRSLSAGTAGRVLTSASFPTLAVGVAEAAGDTLQSSGQGSASFGRVLSAGHMRASGSGALAHGEVYGRGRLLASGSGSRASGVAYNVSGDTSATITASGVGSQAMGLSTGDSIAATGDGSMAFGNVVASTGKIVSSGLGSFSGGYASGGQVNRSSSTASFSMGRNVQALQPYTFTYGLDLTNNTASSFMVGWSATPSLTVTEGKVAFTSYGGNLVPDGDKTRQLGAAATSWDTTFSKVFTATADMPFLDDRDDIALIRGIRGSGKLDPVGREIVDDWTMPDEIMVLHRENWTERRPIMQEQIVEGEPRQVQIGEDVIEHQTGDWIVDSDGKPYFDVTAAIGLGYGAIRQLSREVDDLEAAVYDPELGGVPLVTYVLGLAGLVAALSGYVATLKKQVNDLEARIAALEGVAPNPPNPETEREL